MFAWVNNKISHLTKKERKYGVLKDSVLGFEPFKINITDMCEASSKPQFILYAEDNPVLLWD